MNPPLRAERIYAGGHYEVPDSDTVIAVDQIYVLDPDSFSKKDSVLLDAFPLRMASSWNGNTLFIEVSDYPAGSDRVIALDATTHTLIWSYLGGELGTVLDSGRIILLYIAGRKTLVVDAGTGTPIREFGDTLEFFRGEYRGFETVVSLRGAQEWRLRVLDTKSLQMRGGYTPRLRNGNLIDVRFAVLHPDGSKVLAIGRRSSNTDSWFVIGDINSDSTLMDHRMIFSRGEIAISADGLWAVVTDPSNFLNESFVSLAVIDLSQMTVVKTFTQPEVVSPGQIRFVGDQLRVVSCPAPGEIGAFQVIDIPTLQVTHTLRFPEVNSIPTSTYFFFGPMDVAPDP